MSTVPVLKERKTSDEHTVSIPPAILQDTSNEKSKDATIEGSTTEAGKMDLNAKL